MTSAEDVDFAIRAVAANVEDLRGMFFQISDVQTSTARTNRGLGALTSQIIAPLSPSSIGSSLAALTMTGSPTSTGYPAANRAIFIPFALSESRTAYKMFCLNGSTLSGNVDVGIYDSAGNRLVSMGTTVQSGINSVQLFDIADTVLAIGNYYMAIAVDNTTATLSAWPPVVVFAAELLNVRRMAAAFVLPATATFSALANDNLFIPVFGIAFRSDFA